MTEYDPQGKSPKQPGSKLDAGKSPVFQGVLDYFPRAITAVADVSLYGTNKYAWKGWESVPDGINRYANALARHIVKEAIEGPWDIAAKLDPDHPTDIRHAAQVAWNALARLELILRDFEAREFFGAQENPVALGYKEDPNFVPAGKAGCREQMDPVEFNKVEYNINRGD